MNALGGHINGAINIRKKEDLNKIFFENPKLLKNKEFLSNLKKDFKAVLREDLSKYTDFQEET